MAFSFKKRVQSKSHIVSVDNDDSKAVGEALHRSSKTTKKNKKKHNQLVQVNHKIQSIDSQIEINIEASTNEQPIVYRNECTCDKHYDKKLAYHDYNLTVDKLFDLIFGSNEFVRTYRQAQRFFDDTATEWVRNEATNYRERTLNYKVPYEAPFIGKGTIFTREKQILFDEVPGSHYTLEAEVCNEGVKFSDAFSLILRFCLVQTSLTRTNLCVTAQIIYNKSVNGIIKHMIERNAYSASSEGLKDLNNRLNLLANYKMDQRSANKTEKILITPTIQENVHRTSQVDIVSIDQSLRDINRDIRSSDQDKLLYIVIFLVGILFFIHLYLYMKLQHMDYVLEKIVHLLKI